jgi:mRNA interferase MazF
MREGDLALTPIRQANGQVKNRPVLVLREMPPFHELLVCGVSSQLHQQVSGFDEVITPSDSDFAVSGLRTASLIRLGFLALLPRRTIIGSIDAVAPDRHEHL